MNILFCWPSDQLQSNYSTCNCKSLTVVSEVGFQFLTPNTPSIAGLQIVRGSDSVKSKWYETTILLHFFPSSRYPFYPIHSNPSDWKLWPCCVPVCDVDSLYTNKNGIQFVFSSCIFLPDLLGQD